MLCLRAYIAIVGRGRAGSATVGPTCGLTYLLQSHTCRVSTSLWQAVRPWPWAACVGAGMQGQAKGAIGALCASQKETCACTNYCLTNGRFKVVFQL